MDCNGGLGMRNWGYYDNQNQHLKGNLGLQLMPIVPPDRDSAKPLLPSEGFFHHDCPVPESAMPMEFFRNGWLNNRDNKMVQMMPLNYGYSVIPWTHDGHGVPLIQQLQPPLSSIKEEKLVAMENEPEETKAMILNKTSTEQGCVNKTAGAAVLQKPKKPRKVPAARDGRGRTSKKSIDVLINGISFDISKLPPPVCSCTGAPQQCYRWGVGGWQSACCTTSISVYPLPMSTKRRGARIAGRKMSLGAFKKVLEKFAGEGYELSNPIDLKTYWAKHGTNKFVTIR